MGAILRMWLAYRTDSTMRRKPLTIHDFPREERPRERLLAHGASALSNSELLAILLRTGTAQENALRLAERILAQHGGINGLVELSPVEMAQINGLGAAKIAQVIAAFELGKRIAAYRPEARPKVRTAADAVALMQDMVNLPQENVRVMLLDSANHVIDIRTVYIGTVNAAVLRSSEIFRDAIRYNAPALILFHNHPSGDPSPSPEDVKLTRTLIDAGNLLDIALLDHIIVAAQGWRSIKEMGLTY